MQMAVNNNAPEATPAQNENGRRGARFMTARQTWSNAAAIFTGASVDLDAVACGDEQRDLDFEAVRELGGLHHLARRVALDGGLGVRNFAVHRVRQLHRDGAALVERELAREPFREVVEGVAQI